MVYPDLEVDVKSVGTPHSEPAQHCEGAQGRKVGGVSIPLGKSKTTEAICFLPSRTNNALWI